MSVTALAIIKRAYRGLNVFQSGASIPPFMSADALESLNGMLGTWAQLSLTIPAISREIFPLVAGKGGPSNPYTIGTGGNLNTDRPPSQSSITGVGLVMNASTPAVEIARALYTDDAYEAISIKELTNALFTGAYYNPTFTGGFGTIQLWPVPDNAINSLALYRRRQLSSFADLTTSYDFPPGTEDALAYGLEERLAAPTGRAMPASDHALGVAAFDILQRSNVKLSDLANDFAKDRRGVYNILTGSGGSTS